MEKHKTMADPIMITSYRILSVENFANFREVYILIVH